MAPTLSGPTRTRSIRSGSSEPSTADARTASSSRRVQSSNTLAPGRRRRANPSALADESSNHCRSSIASNTGSFAVSDSRAPRTATPSARTSTARPAASSISSATSSARRRGGVNPGRTSSSVPSSRSPSPACASPPSDSAGCDKRTRSPRPRASSTAARQSVDLPIPASPSSAIAIGPRIGARRSRNADNELSSASLPTTSVATWIPHRDRARPESQ